ncbi:triadin [Amazona ochrocephala]
MSTTTTIIDGKNESVPSSSMKVGKKSVMEDLVTTFSSPAAWLLVVALIVTWSAVAIVMFDLVDYKAFAATYSQHCDDPCLPPGRSVHKLSTEPLRIIHETLEESTDWLYGFFSLLSDIVWSDDDDSDEGEVEPSLTKEIPKQKLERHEKQTPPKVFYTAIPSFPVCANQGHLKCLDLLPTYLINRVLVIQGGKPDKPEKIERKKPLKVTHKDKLERQDKTEKKEKHAAIQKEKHEKPETHEKKAPSKVIQKDKPERREKAEKKPPPKEEKKVKSTKVESKVKKDVKDGKGEAKIAEKVKQAESKTTEVGLIKAKPKVKEEKALQTVTKSEKKDQYAFCRYVIDMFAQGDFYPGHKEMLPPRLLLDHSPRKKPATIEEEKSIVVARGVKKRKDEKKKTDVKRAMTETKKKEKEGKKEKAHEKTGVPESKKADKKEAAASKELKKPAKAPAAKPATKKAAAPGVPEKKEDKATKAAEQDPGKEKESKSPAATKNKEHAKEKEGKNPTALKDKDYLKGKNPKNPEGSKEKETGKRKDVKPPAALKEKDSSKGKEMKASTMAKEKVKKDGEKKATSEKPHEHKHEHVKHEKADSSQTKTEKPIAKKHLKYEKAKDQFITYAWILEVPPVKEASRHHNLTSAPVRYFQCVFLNGPNGFGLQFPANPSPSKEETTHSKTSKRKTKKPGQ